MAQNADFPLDPKPQLSAASADSVPDSLLGIFQARAEYEAGVLARIKVAYDGNDSQLVFRLVGDLLYCGPGAKGKPKRQRKPEGK
jgi:hypothetical protein